jgi:hypothetical protein
MPSMPGIRMSISTTSGWSLRALLDAARAVGGLADDREIRLGRQDHPEPGPQQRLIVNQQNPDRHGSLLLVFLGSRPRPALALGSRRHDGAGSLVRSGRHDARLHQRLLRLGLRFAVRLVRSRRARSAAAATSDSAESSSQHVARAALGRPGSSGKRAWTR